MAEVGVARSAGNVKNKKSAVWDRSKRIMGQVVSQLGT